MGAGLGQGGYGVGPGSYGGGYDGGGWNGGGYGGGGYGPYRGQNYQPRQPRPNYPTARYGGGNSTGGYGDGGQQIDPIGNGQMRLDEWVKGVRHINPDQDYYWRSLPNSEKRPSGEPMLTTYDPDPERFRVSTSQGMGGPAPTSLETGNTKTGDSIASGPAPYENPLVKPTRPGPDLSGGGPALGGSPAGKPTQYPQPNKPGRLPGGGFMGQPGSYSGPARGPHGMPGYNPGPR